jgi:asparagine synthase (glutamine-hydrolysing)
MCGIAGVVEDRPDDRTLEATMAFSREVRLPYLDHKLVEFVFSLSSALKLRHATTKRVLRLAMADVLPDSVCGRLDKIGYAPPEGEWLHGPLREPLTDLFGAGAFADRPWTDAAWTGAAWRRLLGGDERDRADLWRLASVELWARRYLDAHPGPSR